MCDCLELLESYNDEFKNINECMLEIRKMTANLTKNVSELQKKINKDMKALDKKNKKDKKKNDIKEPQGFSKPSLISNIFCDFLKMPHGSKITRCNAVSLISKYVKDNNLYYPENKKMFKLDETLLKLLNARSTDEIGFFTIQPWLNQHFLESKKNITNKPTIETQIETQTIETPIKSPIETQTIETTIIKKI
jgi:chromatin remodeling complex protein RSC6